MVNFSDGAMWIEKVYVSQFHCLRDLGTDISQWGSHIIYSLVCESLKPDLGPEVNSVCDVIPRVISEVSWDEPEYCHHPPIS